MSGREWKYKTVYSDVEELNKTGVWPNGKLPEWVAERVKVLGGSAVSSAILEMAYLDEIKRLCSMIPGPTGEFPERAVIPGDKGEVQIVLGRAEDCVLMDFGTDLSWFACSPDKAREIAALLVQWANLVDDWKAAEAQRGK